MSSFIDNFLVAMPALDKNEFFAESVCYVCDHSASKGAMAFVVNKPLLFTLADLFEQLGMPAQSCLYKDLNLMRGGPVHAENGFVLHRGEPKWESSFRVKDSISVTTSLDILSAIASNNFKEKFIVFLGISMWEAGQLENEINLNAWLTNLANEEYIFEMPSVDLRHTIAKDIGIDLNTTLPWTTYV